MRTEIDLEKEFPYIMADERGRVGVNVAYSEMTRGYVQITSMSDAVIGDISKILLWEEFCDEFIRAWSQIESTAKECAMCERLHNGTIEKGGE